MRSRIRRYCIAVVVAAVATALEAVLPRFFAGVPFFAFWIAILIAALLGGFGPGSLATLLSAAAAAILFEDRSARPIVVGHIAAFVAAGTALSWFVSSVEWKRQHRSRARLNEITRIANAAPVMMWVNDAEGRRTFFSERWLAFTGRTIDEELGEGWTDGIDPRDRDRVTAAFARAAERREAMDIEYRLRRHDGAYRTVLTRANPQTDADGAFDGYIGAAVDIDDIRAAERERIRLTAEIARERERLMSIVSNVPGVVWESWGRPGGAGQQTDFVSDHVERMLGYTVDEWLATPNFWLNIIHPDDRDEAARAAHEHFTAGGSRTNTFRWMTKDGRAIWVESHATVVQDAEGRPIGMRGVTFDITARKRAEDALQFLVNASETLSSTLDYEKFVPEAAQAAVRLIGDWCAVSYTDERGEPRRLAVAHRDPAKRAAAQKLLAIVPSAQRAVNPETAKIDLRQPTIINDVPPQLVDASTTSPEHAALARELGVASMLIAPLVARERFIGAVTFSSAQTGAYDAADAELALLFAKRVAIAIDNAQLYGAAIASSNAKDEFLATVSHELRTPMTATLGWVRMLRLDKLDADMRGTALEAIERSTRAQAKLIEDILDVSSVILGKFRLDAEPIDLRAVVDAALQTVRPAAEAKAIAISIDASQWSGIVNGDADRLQQVVWNLVANAIKFGRKGGRIDITLERAGETARLIVRDDGAGIEPLFLPHVFDRFRQGDSSPTRIHGGLGLGLAIVRHLVELHGGTVGAASEGPGKGATFTVELPALIGEAHDAETGVALPDLHDKRILLVDDERESLDLFSAILRRCGAGVTTALSADEAMLALARESHDLVVTDIAMPGTDGVTLLSAIRSQRPPLASLPAVALTATSDPHDEFARTLRKPIDPVDFAYEVARCVGR